MSKKNQTKNTRQIAKSHEFPGINSVSQNIVSENFLLR